VRIRVGLLGASLLLGGVASARADAGPQRVAVLPVSLLAAPPATGERVRERLARALQSESDVEVVPAVQADQAVDARCGGAPRWDCLEQEQNLLAIGRALDARVVVAGNLAVMGETRVLKLRVVDLSAETVSGEVVEMSGANDEAVLERFAALHARLFPHASPDAPSAPWPVWVGVGAGMLVVATAATVGVLLATGVLGLPGDDGSWDARVSLP
jgi:hypothetical protein